MNSKCPFQPQQFCGFIYVSKYVCVCTHSEHFIALFYFTAIKTILFNSHYCVGINTVILLSVLSLVPPNLRQNLVRTSLLEEKRVPHKGM